MIPFQMMQYALKSPLAQTVAEYVRPQSMSGQVIIAHTKDGSSGATASTAMLRHSIS